MIEQVADNLQQIVSLFRLTQPLAIPCGETDWVVVEAIDPAETAALCLAVSFYLRRTGNRAERLGQPKNHSFNNELARMPES